MREASLVGIIQNILKLVKSVLIGCTVVVVVVFVDGVLLGGMLPIPLYPCSLRERVVFFEFPQYDGASHWPVNGYGLEGACAVYFNTPDSQEQIYEYYSEQLEDNGWVVEGERECTGYVGKCLQAQRDSFRYQVKYIKQGTNVNVDLAKYE